MNRHIVYILYLCILVFLQACVGIDPAVDFEAYRLQSLNEKLSRAQRAIEEKDHVAALYWYQVAQTLAPEDKDISDEVSRLQKILHKGAKRHFIRGEKARQQKRYKQAQIHFQRTLALQPQYKPALKSLREVDLHLMFRQRGKGIVSIEHSDEQDNRYERVAHKKKEVIDPIVRMQQQQLALLVQAQESSGSGQLDQSAGLIKQAKEMGQLTPEAAKQAAAVLLGISKLNLQQGNIETAYLYYRESKETVSAKEFSLLSMADGLSASLAEHLYFLGKSVFPQQIAQALYYWEACAYVKENYSDINRLLTMARRYKYRLESVDPVE